MQVGALFNAGRYTYSLVSMVGDCRVSQVVDIRKGVHCMIPKAIFTAKK